MKVVVQCLKFGYMVVFMEQCVELVVGWVFVVVVDDCMVYGDEDYSGLFVIELFIEVGFVVDGVVVVLVDEVEI